MSSQSRPGNKREWSVSGVKSGGREGWPLIQSTHKIGRQNRERRGQRRSRLRQLGYPSYGAYLKSPAWAAAKAHYRASDQPQDCICGERKGLQIHHKTYERVGEELMTDLVALCATCHSMIHTLNRRGEYGLDVDGLVTAPKRDPELKSHAQVHRALPTSDEDHKEMLRLVSEGMSIAGIAQRLGRRKSTVERHVRKLSEVMP